MVRRNCDVNGCPSHISEVPLHAFPSSAERAIIWKQFCQNPNLEAVPLEKLFRKAAICRKHFAPEQYTTTACLRLNRNALPSLLPPSSFLSNFIEISLNEALRLTPKVEIEDNATEDCSDEIKSEINDSLLDEPQGITPRYVGQNKQDPCHVIEEPAELYALITLPHLEQENLHIEWVYRILSGEEGSEMVVYDSSNKDDMNSFLMIKDSNWDGIDLDKLHLIAIAYRPGILSIRDLNKNHLGLLQNIYFKGKDVIERKYGVIGSQLRIFLPYQPPFYHLNVHFTANSDDIFGSHYAHPLHSVINNIQLFPTYYQVASLTFSLKESDELFKKFEAHGIVKRLQPSR